jgi:glycosyltransferase involved in cell wall biosynthesis
MKILHLVTRDFNGGAARATFRTHQALRAIGCDSWMFVQSKETDEFSVLGPRTQKEKALSRLRPAADALWLSLYRKRSSTIFSANLVPGTLSRLEEVHADLIHLHWITDGFVSMRSLSRIKTPVVWSVQDMWPFTGGCHYDENCGKYKQNCGKCPVLGSSSDWDLSRYIWNQKKRALSGLDVSLIAPSRWIESCIKQSSLFSNRPVHLIPNGVDTNLFRRQDSALVRRLFNLPQNKKLILFGAMSATSDVRKGFQHLSSALEILQSHLSNPKEVEIVIFGASAPKEPVDLGGFKVNYVPALRDETSLPLVYSCADVIVVPSIQDNLPNMVIEAMACGTPVVAFSIGGIPDMIDHFKTGYLAQPFSAADLASGIRWVVENTSWNEVSLKAREKIETEFDIRFTARNYLKVYGTILKGKL